MDLTRTETIDGFLAQYTAFADLVAGLDEAEWTKASRCDGFEVRDVAGHVIGLAEDVVAGVPGSRTAEEEAATVRHDRPSEAAARLRAAIDALRLLGPAIDDDDVWSGPSGLDGITMGRGVLTLLFDTYVHGDDIRSAIGRESDADPAALRAAVSYLAGELESREWGPARIDITHDGDALGALTIGPVTTETATRTVDALAFVLAATGRLDPAPLGLDGEVNIYAT